MKFEAPDRGGKAWPGPPPPPPCGRWFPLPPGPLPVIIRKIGMMLLPSMPLTLRWCRLIHVMGLRDCIV